MSSSLTSAELEVPTFRSDVGVAGCGDWKTICQRRPACTGEISVERNAHLKTLIPAGGGEEAARERERGKLCRSVQFLIRYSQGSLDVYFKAYTVFPDRKSIRHQYHPASEMLVFSLRPHSCDH